MRPRPRVLYTLPDGAQSSVLLRTDLFDELTAPRDVEWYFVSPMAEHADFARSFQRLGVHLLAWRGLRPGFVHRQLELVRKELWRLRVRNATAEVFTRRMRWLEPRRYHVHRRLAWLASWLPGVEGVLNALESWFSTDAAWRELLDDVRPDAVVLGSGGTKPQEAPLARLAAGRGIPCFNIIPSWDNLTSKGPLELRGQPVAVWCERMRLEAIGLYGCRPEQVIVTGPPPFDPHRRRPELSERARFLCDLGLDPNRKLLTYTSVHPGICPFSVGYVGQLAGLIESGRLVEPSQLLVRMHPQDDFGAFERLPALAHVRLERPGRYRGDTNGNQAILEYDPSPEDVRHLTATLAFSDVAVNIASTITLEACALDRPVINLAYNLVQATARFDMAEYYQLDHYQPVTDSGAVRIVAAEADLCDAINEALSDPHLRSPQRRALYREYDAFGDGCAAKRLGAAIRHFVLNAAGRASEAIQMPQRAA